MVHMTVDIEETDYQYLEQAAQSAGVTIQSFLKHLISRQHLVVQEDSQEKRIQLEQPHRKKSRWAQLSERIRQDPPLRGAGDYVRECSKEFRDDFALHHDEASER